MALVDEIKSQESGNGQSIVLQRPSLLIQHISEHGAEGLNQEYVDTALTNGLGFGATAAGVKKDSDGKINLLYNYTRRRNEDKSSSEASATPAPGSVQAQNLEFLSQYQKENSLLARLKKTGQAAVSGIKDAVASNVDAARTMYEAGQSGREAQMQEEVKEIEENLARARRDYDQLLQLHNGDTNDKDVKAAVNVIDRYETLLSAYKKAPEAQRGATEETSKLADEVKKSAEADIERAKKGRGKLGSFFMDVVAGGTQLASDALLGAGISKGVGVSKNLASNALLGVRAFGGATQEARQGGGTIGQQLGYGAAVAATEMLTEKLADGLAGIYGKGVADELTEEVVRRLVSTPAGQTALRTLYGIGSEGVEEVVSEIVNPALKAIYDKGESAKESYGTKEGRKALAADSLYSGLVGAALGAAGSTVNIATGRDAKANARNQELSDIYKEIGTPGIKQAVKDRGILENIRGGKDYGNLSIGEQASEAMEALRGRTPDSVRAGQLAGARNRLFEIQQQRAAEAKSARQNAAPTAQPAAAQEPTTRNPLYEAIRPRAEAVAERATTSQTSQNAPQTQEAPTGEITPQTAQNAQSEAGAQPQTAETAQARLERAQARYDEIDRLFSSNEVSDEDAPRLVAEMEERYNEIQELTPLAERERQSAADAQTQQQRVEAGEVSNGYGTAENHIDRRTPESVAKTGMKSFQFDHPQLHDYYVEAAQALMDEVQAAEAVDYERKVNKNTQRKTGSAIKGPVRRLMDLGLTKPQILKCLEDIIADNGQENYAAAKKVELVLNDMLTNGWTSTRGRKNYHEPNAAYVSAKDAIGGGIKADSWEKYLAQNELSLIDGTVTEEQLRQEWEQMHPQEAAATAAEQEPAPESSQPVVTASAGTEQSAGTIPASEQTTAERTNGQDERGYTGPLVDTQDRVFETQLTDAEKQIPGLTAEEARHIQHHDAEVDIRAKERIAAGVNQARADLLAAESWSDEDTATAGYIIQAELEAAEKAGSVEERAAIYKRLAELKKQWNKQGTEQGRALRQRQRFVAEDMVSAAADILYSDKSGKNEKALRKLNPQAKDAIMGKVREYARRFNDMQKNGGTVGDLVQLIKDVSVQRRTTGLFSRENGRAVDFALSEVAKQDGGVDFLKELATTQIKSIASDYLKPGIIDQIKSWRFMAMLSNAATTTANAGSNFVFGSFMEALSGNLALPFDMLMSQVTGQREVAGELGAFSKTKWQGSYDAMLRSFLEVTLDAETAQADYGYKELKGGTFKMVGNPLERLLATMQKYQGYALKTTDQAAKGGTEAQVRKGLGKLADQGKAKAENIGALADQEAKYRTLQTDGKVSKALNWVRKGFDEAAIGNERTGKYGLGSDIMPFAQVPANAVAVTLESNPAIGAVKAIVETAKVLADGKNVEPGQQAKAARAWGRAANGVAVAATFAALAAKGYLRDEDDENKDIAAQRKAEGRSGVQLNISALLRGDPSEREDDLWIDFSWIPPLNGLANFGVDIYRAYTEDGHISLKDISLASGEALASAFMDFPAVSKISSMIKTYQNSEAEGVVGKGLETIATGAAQTASSILVPNAVRAVAAGLDPYERDVYNTDTYGEGIVNNLISGIPGLRETLPERLDTFGQPVKNEGGALHFLDKTLIPGNVNRHDRQSAASKYVEALIAKTGDKKLQPSRYPPYKATLGDGDNKQNVELTAAERREYQQTRGNAISEMTEALAESRAMRGATDGQKALFSAIKNAANHAAEAELAESRGIEQTPTQINGKDFMSFAEMGAPESVLDRLAKNGMTGKGRNMLWDALHGNGESPQNIVSAIDQIDPDGNGRASQADLYAYLRNKSNLTAEQKQSIWETYNPTGKTSYADYAAKNGGDESKATKSSGNALYDYYAERMKNAK